MQRGDQVLSRLRSGCRGIPLTRCLSRWPREFVMSNRVMLNATLLVFAVHLSMLGTFRAPLALEIPSVALSLERAPLLLSIHLTRHSMLRPSRQLAQRTARSFTTSSIAHTTPTKPLDPPPSTPLSTPPAPGPTIPSTHFGFKDVPESLKETLGTFATTLLPCRGAVVLRSDPDPLSSARVRSLASLTVKGVFSSVASSYDVMNDAMSLGIHRLWKDHYVQKMDPHGGMRCLDVAGGTGDIAIRLLDHAKDKWADRDTHVQVLDINPEMLEEGKKRFAKTMYHGGASSCSLRARGLHRDVMPTLADNHVTLVYTGPQVSFTLGNAEQLDTIPDNSLDLYTIAFGIRNCTHIDRVLKEAYRVLKPGGVFSCLEFSKVHNPLLAK